MFTNLFQLVSISLLGLIVVVLIAIVTVLRDVYEGISKIDFTLSAMESRYSYDLKEKIRRKYD